VSVSARSFRRKNGRCNQNGLRCCLDRIHGLCGMHCTLANCHGLLLVSFDGHRMVPFGVISQGCAYGLWNVSRAGGVPWLLVTSIEGIFSGIPERRTEADKCRSCWCEKKEQWRDSLSLFLLYHLSSCSSKNSHLLFPFSWREKRSWPRIANGLSSRLKTGEKQRRKKRCIRSLLLLRTTLTIAALKSFSN
jgi:hypothetical protein